MLDQVAVGGKLCSKTVQARSVHVNHALCQLDLLEYLRHGHSIRRHLERFQPLYGPQLMFADRGQIEHEILVGNSDIWPEKEPFSSMENYFFPSMIPRRKFTTTARNWVLDT